MGERLGDVMRGMGGSVGLSGFLDSYEGHLYENTNEKGKWIKSERIYEWDLFVCSVNVFVI